MAIVSASHKEAYWKPHYLLHTWTIFTTSLSETRQKSVVLTIQQWFFMVLIGSTLHAMRIIAYHWSVIDLDKIVLLWISKRQYIGFHKTSAIAPITLPTIKAHTCCRGKPSCSCEAFSRTEVKYLGILLDDKFNFDRRIPSLFERVRKTANILKMLRDAASPAVLNMKYYVLCQSLLTYCISSWGCAAKTHMLQLERVQRSVLMLKKPQRYPTTDLYEEVCVLNVRRLFALKTTIPTTVL